MSKWSDVFLGFLVVSVLYAVQALAFVIAFVEITIAWTNRDWWMMIIYALLMGGLISFNIPSSWRQED